MNNTPTVAPKFATDLTGRDISWFAQRVERATREVFCEIITINPAIARRMLENNEDNRPVSESTIEQIASDIVNNRWQMNGESIIYSRDGYLNDGQHRLLAVMRANKAIQTVAVFGVERSSRMTVDIGKQRSASNFLHMAGATNSSDVAVVTNLWLTYNKFQSLEEGVSYVPANTKPEIHEFYNKNAAKINSAVNRFRNDSFCKSVVATPIITAYLIIHERNSGDCELFFDRLVTGVNLAQNDAILMLRQRLNEMSKQKTRSAFKLESVLRYWNAWRNSKTIKNHIYPQGVYPKVVP